MRTIFILVLLVFFSQHSHAQRESLLEEEFEMIAGDWMSRSEALRTYAGINEYCQNSNFRESVNAVLASIHEYDSMILAKLSDQEVSSIVSEKEQKKTLRDIYQLEIQYSKEDFIEHMRETCTLRNEIERNADDLRNGVGMESYDGKVLIIETELQKYLHRIDKLVSKVDEHLHVLHIEGD